MKLERIAIAVAAALLAALTVGVALVESYATKDPARAAAAWAGHPSVILKSGLAEIGSEASQGKPIARPLVDRLVASTTKAPLAPEPFLVFAVDATTKGRSDLAGRAFLAARQRDPRSVASRYFLAQHFLRTGQTREGLNEISALTRLVPGSLAGIGPYLAAYARQPEAREEVRAMLRRNPELEPVVLNALAADARDAPVAMAIWNGQVSDRIKPWQSRMLESQIAAGQYREAHSAWLRFTGRVSGDGDPNQPDFAATELGPFGWSLASGSSGVSEAETGSRLHVLYYGRDDAGLAGKMMMLEPGKYRLSMRVSAASMSTGSLAWTLYCLPSGREIAHAALRPGALKLPFEVARDDCEAQRIELRGIAPELPEQVEVTIADFRIAPEGRQ